jgi:uncharacterized protein (DUF3820 family)
MALTDESKMPWGKHEGEKMANVPPDYLLWLYENKKCYGDVKDYIKDNLDAIKFDIEFDKKRNNK